MNEVRIVIEDRHGAPVADIARFTLSGRPIVGEQVLLDDKLYAVVRVEHSDDSGMTGAMVPSLLPTVFLRATTRRPRRRNGKSKAEGTGSHEARRRPSREEAAVNARGAGTRARRLPAGMRLVRTDGEPSQAAPPPRRIAEEAVVPPAASSMVSTGTESEATPDPQLAADPTTALSEARPALGVGSPAEACLILIYPPGPNLGKRFELGSKPVTIGRRGCDILIDRESVSRKHARLEPIARKINDAVPTGASGWRVIDLDSTNGTSVNDRPIARHRLVDGDLLQVGNTIFKFLAGAGVEAAYHEQIYRLTVVDGLTQIYNKRFLLESLDRELARSQRARHPVSLVLFDIDHFKRINDEHGHLTGDSVLKGLAERVGRRMRQEEILARFGGEEFAALLVDATHDSARIFAEDVRRIVEMAPFVAHGLQLPVTISVGVATTTTDYSATGLIQAADERLYEAKRSGRNRVVGAAPAAPLHLP